MNEAIGRALTVTELFSVSVVIIESGALARMTSVKVSMVVDEGAVDFTAREMEARTPEPVLPLSLPVRVAANSRVPSEWFIRWTTTIDEEPRKEPFVIIVASKIVVL